MNPEKAERRKGGNVNKNPKDETFSYVPFLKENSPYLYINLQIVCIMKRRAKKKGGGVNVSTQNLFTLRFDEI